MASKAVHQQTDQKYWKEMFEGSLTKLNGGAIPASQQPIFRPKQDRSNMYCPDSSKAAIAAAAASLAALWQVSKRP